MRVCEITTVRHEPHSLWTPSKDHYTFRPERGYVRLQRLAFWFLRKIRCHYMEETVTYQRMVIEPKDIIDQILTTMEWTREDLAAENPERILMGPDEFSALRKNAVEDGPTAFGPFEFRTEYNVNYKVFGLAIQVIPWMSGVLILPTDVEQVRPRR